MLTACQPTPSTPAKLSGEIEDLKNEKVYLVAHHQVQDYKHYVAALDSTQTDSLGRFTFNLELESPQLLQVRGENGFGVLQSEYLYLSPGDSLSFLQKDQKLHFSGRGAPVNQLSVAIRELSADAPRLRERVKQSKEAFGLELDERRKREEEFLAKKADSLTLDPDYRDLLARQIIYRWANDYFYYQRYHRYYTAQEWAYVPYDSLPYPFQDDLPLDAETMPGNGSYMRVIHWMLEDHYQGEIAGLPDSQIWEQEMARKFQLARTAFSGIHQEVALVDISQNLGTFLLSGKEHFYDHLQEIKQHYDSIKTDERFHAFFSQNYASYQALAPGQAAPDFSLPTPEGKNMSLSDFSGKVVYVDFWGTWCGPCIEAIPKSRALQAAYAGREDVAFVNIALEYGPEDIERWKKFVQENDFPGIHLVADKQFHNPILAPYKLNFAPTYVLIDAEGKLVDARAEGPGTIGEDLVNLLGSR